MTALVLGWVLARPASAGAAGSEALFTSGETAADRAPAAGPSPAPSAPPSAPSFRSAASAPPPRHAGPRPPRWTEPLAEDHWVRGVLARLDPAAPSPRSRGEAARTLAGWLEAGPPRPGASARLAVDELYPELEALGLNPAWLDQRLRRLAPRALAADPEAGWRHRAENSRRALNDSLARMQALDQRLADLRRRVTSRERRRE